jgi:hypothetical protein
MYLGFIGTCEGTCERDHYYLMGMHLGNTIKNIGTQYGTH